MAPRYAEGQPKGFTNRIERIAIVGAAGRVGSEITKSLLATGKHTVTALTRSDSTSELPKGVRVAKINYDDESTLVEALKGQQFLVISLSFMAPKDTQGKLIRAAAKAGVPYVMPNWWGPDVADESMVRDAILGGGTLDVVKEAKELGLVTIMLSCGFWFEWSLGGSQDRFGFDIANRSVIFYDDGEQKIDISTWQQCGRAVAALLSLPELPQNAADASSPTLARWGERGVLYAHSFLLSQHDMFESLKRVTGTADADWKLSSEPSAQRWAEGKKAMESGDFGGFPRAMYSRVFFPNGGGNFTESRGLDNEVLGLPQEDLDAFTKRAIEYSKKPGFK